MKNNDKTKDVESIKCPLCKLDAFLWYERDKNTKVYSCSSPRCKAETIMVTSEGTMIGAMNGEIIYDTTSGILSPLAKNAVKAPAFRHGDERRTT